eukprot:614512-Rhodomonas_salina.2
MRPSLTTHPSTHTSSSFHPFSNSPPPPPSASTRWVVRSACGMCDVVTSGSGEQGGTTAART